MATKKNKSMRVAKGYRNAQVLLPLLNILMGLPSEKRIILLNHLDESTKDGIYKCIRSVLHSDEVSLRRRLFLKTKLQPYKSHLRYLARSSKNSSKVLKTRRLTQIGGGPMEVILRTAVPMLLNIFDC